MILRQKIFGFGLVVFVIVLIIKVDLPIPLKSQNPFHSFLSRLSIEMDVQIAGSYLGVSALNCILFCSYPKASLAIIDEKYSEAMQ